MGELSHASHEAYERLYWDRSRFYFWETHFCDCERVEDFTFRNSKFLFMRKHDILIKASI